MAGGLEQHVSISSWRREGDVVGGKWNGSRVIEKSSHFFRVSLGGKDHKVGRVVEGKERRILSSRLTLKALRSFTWGFPKFFFNLQICHFHLLFKTSLISLRGSPMSKQRV